MEANLPTTPGPYWWREKDGDEWEYGEVYRGHSGDLYWETMAIGGQPLDHMQGQWAKAHNPDEGIVAWAVFNIDEFFVSAPTKRLAQQAASQAMYGRLDRWDALEVLGGTCEPVTIYRKEKE